VLYRLIKSEAHDKELYQKFKQDIDNEVADMRDLLRQHIMLSDREEQLKPLGLGKRNKTLVLCLIFFSFFNLLLFHVIKHILTAQLVVSNSYLMVLFKHCTASSQGVMLLYFHSNPFML
jgi:hypothetical protein